MIAAVGYANLDLLVRVPNLPGSGDRVHATSMERTPGGMAANAAAAAARFGAEVAFVGAVGDDRDGALLLESLTVHGVDVGSTATDRWTSTAVVLVAPDGQRAILSQDDAVGPGEIQRALDRLVAAGGGLLYLDGYRWPWAADLLCERDPRVAVAVDVDGMADPAALPSAAAVADHLIASRSHLAALLSPQDVETTAHALAQVHRVHVIVTAGERGWWMTDGRSTSEGPALDVDVVDSTGAGDAFCGAYLAGLDGGARPHEAARLAAAAAALSTTGQGARAALATRAQAQMFMDRGTKAAVDPRAEG